MFSSETMNNFKHVSMEGEFLKSREFINSDFYQNQAHNQQESSGLARYRSAPSSFLAALLDSTTADNNNNNSSSGDESEAALLCALMNGPDLNQKNRVQYAMKQEIGVETETTRPGGNGYGDGDGQGMGYESAVSGGGGAIVGSYSVGMGMDITQLHFRRNNNNNNASNLVRQSSSPAGFFNGYGVMGEGGNYRDHNNHGEANSSATGLSSHMNFSSGPSSRSRFMPSIPEIVNESIVTRSPENGQLRNGNNSANAREFEPAFPHDSWNDSPFNSLKRNRDGDMKMFSNFNGLENQNGENRKNSHGLVHHMSLPKTSSELATAEKFLQFQQDVVPCQVRAKRGFATHPRSIAERVRRTRISEKMKKLQDLFPNMDKQTNTADMLDLAVEYIKDLQKQVQTLTDRKAKCICPSKPQQTNPTK